jgi:hypothetical protein
LLGYISRISQNITNLQSQQHVISAVAVAFTTATLVQQEQLNSSKDLLGVIAVLEMIPKTCKGTHFSKNLIYVTFVESS